MRKKFTILGVSLIALILILSSIAIVSSGSSSSYYSSEHERRHPPGGMDPGNMTRKIGGFENRIGSFVSFETIEDGIANHSVFIGEDEHISIFDEISVEDFNRYDERTAGQTHFLNGHGAEFRLFDNPSTMLKLDVHSFEGADREVSFRLGDMEIEEEKDGMVRISDGTYSGNLIYRDVSIPSIPDPIGGDAFGGENAEFINFTVEGRATFIFRMETDGFRDEIVNFMREGMRKGRIGGEFRIESIDDTYAQTSFSYRDLSMEAQLRDGNKLEMLVSSQDEEGTILHLDISSSVMDISSEEDVELRFDDEIATNLEDISDLEVTDEPSYTLIHGEEGTHIFFNVPSFSTHSITVEHLTEVVETAEQVFGSLIYYAPTALITAGLVIVGLLYKERSAKSRKKDKKDKKVSMGESFDKNNDGELKSKSTEKSKDERASRKD